MLYGLLLTFFVILCVLLMALILIQKSKGSLGLGNMGGGMQMLFGGSGGQSLFQKATWVLGALFMLSSLGLAILKSSKMQIRYTDFAPAASVKPATAPVIPTAPDSGLNPVEQTTESVKPATTESAAVVPATAPVEQKTAEKPSKP